MIRQFEIPPLAHLTWKMSVPSREAVDFSMSIKEPAISVSSSMTSSFSGGRIATTYRFSDSTSAAGEKLADGKSLKLSFVASDGKTPITGALGVSLNSNCVVNTVTAGTSAAAAGISQGQTILAIGDKETGPFYRVPNGDSESDHVLRERMFAGPTDSNVWLRVKDAGGHVRSVSVVRNMSR